MISRKKKASEPAHNDILHVTTKKSRTSTSENPGGSGAGFSKSLPPKSISSSKPDSIKPRRNTKDKYVKKSKMFVMPVEEDPIDSDAEEPDLIPVAVKKPKPVPAEIDWSEPDLMELITRMEHAIPSKDNLKLESRVQKLAWDEVCFGDHTAEQCKEVWMIIQARLRRFRLLREVLEDAKDWVTKPWTNFYRSSRGNRHPELPKRPLSTYMLFYLEKKDQVAKEHPSLEMTGVSKVIAEMYKGLSDKRKKKYTEKAAEERKVYERKLEQFYRDHPGQVPKPSSPKESKSARSNALGPQKPPPPFKLFFTDKLRKHKDDPNLDKAAFLLKCKDQWRLLSDKKKAEYINRVMEEENRYQDELRVYMTDNPDFVPPGAAKSILTKDEKSLIEKVAGKPEKPPNSGYSLFSRLMLASNEIKQTPPKERMAKISLLWKKMSEEDQSKYKQQVSVLLDQYKLEYATYLESLSEEKKAEELIKNQPKRKAVPKSVSVKPATKKKKPVEDKEDNSKLNRPKAVSLYKNEPAQPPVNVGVLYLENFMKSAVHIPYAQREKKGSQAWQDVPESERAKLRKELAERKQQYIKNFEKFLKGLSQEELKEYSLRKVGGQAAADSYEEYDSASECSASSHSHSDSDSSNTSDSGNDDASSYDDDND